jgi:hypothetical protein
MSEVTCPRCATRQPIGAHAPGYTCVACDSVWVFATCGSCGDRFHMLPGTRGWTCPTCGAEHGYVAALVPAAAAPEELLDADGDPAAVADVGPRRSQPSIMPLMAVAGVILVVLVAFALTRGGGGAGGSSPSPSVDPVTALCLDLRNLQTPRVDALTRVLQGLPAHADAIAATGNAALAANVRALAPAITAYRDALATQADDTQALQGMQGALAQLPC